MARQMLYNNPNKFGEIFDFIKLMDIGLSSSTSVNVVFVRNYL